MSDTHHQEATHNQTLEKLGWNDFFQIHLPQTDPKKGLPARVVGVRKNSFYLSRGEKEWLATTAGKLTHAPHGRYPVVGDWVLVSETLIHEVLPRKNELVRGASGNRGKLGEGPGREQIMAANLDGVWVVCGLDRDFNLRRIERYVTLAYNCGISPVIVLTKADLHENPEAAAGEVESIAFGVPVHLVSARENRGLDELEGDLAPGRTITLVGSSGAGKSTLLNRLYGTDVQATGAVSEKIGKGMHTTTSRDLIVMPQGGMVIDNPGIREIALWDGEDGASQAFPDIEGLAMECRFSDCSHLHEPGCRVLRAVADGRITRERLESYHKLQRELSYFDDRQHKSADRLEKERWKGVSLKVKSIKNKKNNQWRG